MSKRSLRKIAEKRASTINELYDLKIGEILELHEIVKSDGALKGITLAFLYGYEMGVRATKAEKAKVLPTRQH